MVDMLRCAKSSSWTLSTGPKPFPCKIKLVSHHIWYSGIYNFSWLVNASRFLVSSVIRKVLKNFYDWLYYSHTSVKNKTILLNQLTARKMKCFITEKYKLLRKIKHFMKNPNYTCMALANSELNSLLLTHVSFKFNCKFHWWKVMLFTKKTIKNNSRRCLAPHFVIRLDRFYLESP